MSSSLINRNVDFQALREQMATARGFPHFCIDNFLDEAFAEQVHASFPSYEEAVRVGESFNAVNEKLKTQVSDAKLFKPPMRQLHELLASDALVAKISRMSGIEGLIPDPTLMGAGIHETNYGGHLDVHVDFNFNEGLGLYRRLNILIYFNKDWKKEYGGYLDLWDEDVKNCLGAFAPVFNRAAGFATSETSWHGVTPVNCPPGRMRQSFAVYYYTKEAPPWWNGVKHTTIFRARPDEYWKGTVAMPAEKVMRATHYAADRLKRGVKKILSA